MQEVAACHFAHRLDFTSSPTKAPLAFAQEKYEKLLHLADTMGREISRGDHNPDHIIAFQYVEPAVFKHVST